MSEGEALRSAFATHPNANEAGIPSVGSVRMDRSNSVSQRARITCCQDILRRKTPERMKAVESRMDATKN